MNWGTVGWLVIAAIIVLATAGLHRSARWAQTFLREHVPPEELVGIHDEAGSPWLRRPPSRSRLSRLPQAAPVPPRWTDRRVRPRPCRGRPTAGSVIPPRG